MELVESKADDKPDSNGAQQQGQLEQHLQRKA